MTIKTRKKETEGEHLEVAPLRKFINSILPAVVLAVIVIGARSTLADHYVVPTGSMKPTVHVGDRLVVSKITYGFRVPFTTVWLARFATPSRGDVVVLESPHDSKVLLKRIIATPGDMVTVRGGEVFLNGEAARTIEGGDGVREFLGKEHPISLISGGGPDFGPQVIPAGSYLVMGDNRGSSFDGRSFGLLAEDEILGRAVGVYFSDGAPAWRGL